MSKPSVNTEVRITLPCFDTLKGEEIAFTGITKDWCGFEVTDGEKKVWIASLNLDVLEDAIKQVRAIMAVKK